MSILRVGLCGAGRARWRYRFAGASGGERLSGDEVVTSLAEEQADGGVVFGCLDLGVHSGELEVELVGVAGLEGVCLEFHDDVALGKERDELNAPLSPTIGKWTEMSTPPILPTAFS